MVICPMKPGKRKQMLQLHVTEGTIGQTAAAKGCITAQLFPCLPLNKDINLDLSSIQLLIFIKQVEK